MIRSMTGFGKGVATGDDIGLTVEIRSVNSRQREVRCRLPQPLFPLESELRARVQERVARGRVDVHVTWERGSAASGGYALNLDGALAMLEAWKTLEHELGRSDPPRIDALLRMPGVIEAQPAAELDPEQARGLMLAATDAALEQHATARGREGETLLADLADRAGHLVEVVSEIRTRLEGAPERQAAELRERVKLLLEDVAVDESRVAQEIALAVQRSDTTEELVRLDAHFARVAELLQPDQDAIGRELEFLVQEIRRESNTLGAKSSDPEIDKRVLAIKSDLEKIREQAANLE